MLAVVMPILLMWQGVWSDHSCTLSKQNAAPSPESVIRQGTRIAVSPDIVKGGGIMLDTALLASNGHQMMSNDKNRVVRGRAA